MTPLIIANWKMNFTLKEACQLISSLELDKVDCKLIIAPPLAFLSHISSGFPRISLAAQDVSKFSQFGAKTGECSAEIIKSCGVNYAIIGHSERRENFYETNRIVNKKVLNCINAGITPIICIGEKLEARKNNNYKDFILEQIRESIPENCQNCIIAYEPVWAIGTGITPSLDEIKEIADLIKNSKYSTKLAKNSRLVYGGSANINNFKDILAVPHISGLLIGNASLELENFKKIISIN